MIAGASEPNAAAGGISLLGLTLRAEWTPKRSFFRHYILETLEPALSAILVAEVAATSILHGVIL